MAIKRSLPRGAGGGAFRRGVLLHVPNIPWHAEGKNGDVAEARHSEVYKLGTKSLTILPSRISIRREAAAAISALCVTRIKVASRSSAI